MIKLAVIFTCYNRKDKTEKCINGLLSQKCKYDILYDYYICDDRSTDGTPEMIRSVLPDSHVIISEGNLFWCKGMYTAMSEAVKEEHDFYLMINDDMLFYDSAVETALDSYYSHACACGMVGCTKSMDEAEITYGGRRYVNHKNIGKTVLVDPSAEDKHCDVANWNFFLVPNEVIKGVGLIDNYYAHSTGDFDYCIQMRKAGYPIFVSSGFVGKTDRNSRANTSGDVSLKKSVRLKKYFSVKEHPPKSDFHFFVKNYGFPGFFYYIFLTGKGIAKILFS